MGTDVADEPGIRWEFVFWDFVPRYESHGVGAGGHSGTYSVNEASQLVGEGGAPDWCLACSHQVPIFQRCTCCRINDCIDGVLGLNCGDDVACDGVPCPAVHG